MKPTTPPTPTEAEQEQVLQQAIEKALDFSDIYESIDRTQALIDAAIEKAGGNG